jgi:hypothetical protein
VTIGADGVLEIRHGPGNGNQEDPDQIQLQSPFGDVSANGPGELEVGKAFEQRMAAATAPSDRTSDRGPAGLRGRGESMRSHYRAR